MTDRLAGLRVPEAHRDVAGDLVGRTDAFCAAHLDEGYAGLCRDLVGVLARKRRSPLEQGDRQVWAATIVHVVAFVNDLGAPDADPYLPSSRLAELTGCAQGTVERRSREVRRLLGVDRYERDWCHPEVLAALPDMVEVNGLVVRLDGRGGRPAAGPGGPGSPGARSPAFSDDPLRDLAEAESAADLRARLGILRPQLHGGTAPEAVALAARQHDDDSARTVLLLVTLRRWEGCVVEVVELAAEQEVLGEDDRDRLAALVLGDEGPLEPVPGRRVPPLLRRWAAAWQLRRGAPLAAVVRRAERFTSRQRYPIEAGLVDALDALGPPDDDRALAIALGSGSSATRRTALAAVSRRNGLDAARERALADPAPQVREWFLAQGPPAEQPGLFD